MRVLVDVLAYYRRGPRAERAQRCDVLAFLITSLFGPIGLGCGAPTVSVPNYETTYFDQGPQHAAIASSRFADALDSLVESAPTGFVTLRGEQLRPDTWELALAMPGMDFCETAHVARAELNVVVCEAQLGSSARAAGKLYEHVATRVVTLLTEHDWRESDAGTRPYARRHLVASDGISTVRVEWAGRERPNQGPYAVILTVEGEAAP